MTGLGKVGRVMAVSGARKVTVAWLLCALALTGCGRYYYGKPNASALDFRADSLACINDIGIPSPNKQVALVAREPYQRCMLAKGWTREQRVNTSGWYRGVEEDQQVVDLATGPVQPPADTGISPRMLSCRETFDRSGRQDRHEQYRNCLRQ